MSSEYLPHLEKFKPIRYRNSGTNTDVKMRFKGRQKHNDVVVTLVGKVNGKRVNSSMAIGMSNFEQQGQFLLNAAGVTQVRVTANGKLDSKPINSTSLLGYRVRSFNSSSGAFDLASEDGGTVSSDGGDTSYPESGGANYPESGTGGGDGGDGGEETDPGGDPGGGSGGSGGSNGGDDNDDGKDDGGDDGGGTGGGGGGGGGKKGGGNFWGKLAGFLIGVGLLAVGVVAGMSALALIGGGLLVKFATDLWYGDEDEPKEGSLAGTPGPCTRPVPV